MPLLGATELALIGVGLLLLILGPKKLPELAGAIGQSKKEYQESLPADEADEGGV